MERSILCAGPILVSSVTLAFGVAAWLRHRYPKHTLGRPLPTAKIPICDPAPQEPGRFPSYDGVLLKGHWWRKDIASIPRGLVLLVHGFGEHGSLYDGLGNSLASRSFWAFAVDLRGFGVSQRRGAFPGQRFLDELDAHARDVHAALQHCLRAVAEAFPDHPVVPLFIYGHSMGAGAVHKLLAGSTGNEVSVQGAVFSGVGDGGEATGPLENPLVKAGFKILYNIAPDMAVGKIEPTDMTQNQAHVQRMLDDVWCRSSGVFRVAYIRSCLAEDSEKNTHTKAAVPSALVLYGTRDKFCGQHGAEKFLADQLQSPDKEMRTFSELYHNLVHEPAPPEGWPPQASPIETICTWIEKRVGAK